MLLEQTVGLLEGLPIPCIYFRPDRIITYANGKAKRTISCLDQRKTKLEGTAIHQTTFVHACLARPAQFLDALELDVWVDAGEGAFRGTTHGERKDERSIDLDTLESSSSTSWTWTLSKLMIDDEQLFCLTAHFSTQVKNKHIATTATAATAATAATNGTPPLSEEAAESPLDSRTRREAISKLRATTLAGQCLHNILNNMDIVIFEVDSEYNFKSAQGNLDLEHHDNTWWDTSAWTGMEWHDVISVIKHQDSRDTIAYATTEILEGRLLRETIDYEVGGKHLRTIFVPIKEANGDSSSISGMLGVSIDFTADYDNKQAALTIEAMNRTGRMKDAFVANVSHELRTPIAGLIGLLDLMLDTRPSEAQVELIKNMQTFASSLSRIVNDLLDFSKTEANVMTIEKLPFQLGSLLRELQQANQPLVVSKQLEMKYTSTTTTPFPALLGDAVRVRQIVHNLLSNAIKFTQHGSIELRATHQLRDDSTCSVEITVEDTGVGIDAETMSRLFRPFVQADETTTRIYGGTGLGLVISRKLARAMNGDMSLESTKGQGTLATVSLVFDLAPPDQPDSVLSDPVVTSMPQEVSDPTSRAVTATIDLMPHTNQQELPILQKRPPSANPQWRDISILIVDDNALLQKVVDGLLKSLGISRTSLAQHGGIAVDYVTKASRKLSDSIVGVIEPESTSEDPSCNTSTQDSLVDHDQKNEHTQGNLVDHDQENEQDVPASFDSKPVRPDLIFMDCQMPVLDGFETTRQLRANVKYDGIIVALTASATDGYREKCLEAGMNDYVTKPFTKAKLYEVLKKWLPAS